MKRIFQSMFCAVAFIVSLFAIALAQQQQHLTVEAQNKEATNVAAASTTQDVERVRRFIDAGNARWIEAQKSADAKSLATLFAEDGVQFAPQGAVTRGRKRIEEQTAARMLRTGAAIDYTIKTVEIWLVDDLAYETGKYTLKFQPKNKLAIEDAGKYVTIWQRQPDGSWKIHADFGVPE